MIACIPGGNVWFLRLALAFLSHLQRDGQVADRRRGRIVGNPGSHPFNFDQLRGGPLYWAPDLVSTGHLFIGHTVCPGFDRVSPEFPWWTKTGFCAPGYDYLHDGLNYGHVPVDMAPHAFAAVSVGDVDNAAWRDPRHRAVLIHGDPVAQAAAFFSRCIGDARPDYSRLEGRPLVDWRFEDYLFAHALPSYAKTFVSYQAMSRAVPGSVRLFPQDALLAQPADTLAAVVAHLGGRVPHRGIIEDAVALAHPEHIQALESELDRKLDGSCRRRTGRPSMATAPSAEQVNDPALVRRALAALAAMGVDMTYFPTPSAEPNPITATGRA